MWHEWPTIRAVRCLRHYNASVSESAVQSAPSNTASQTELPRQQYLAARKLCRQHAPDLFFASHQLGRQQRFAVYAVNAVVRQITEIMGAPQIDCAATCTTGGCGSGGCDGESIAQRQNVCLAVIDHLEQGLETGKDDLDAYLGLREAVGLQRGGLERFVRGLAAELSTARFATWKSVRRTFDDSAGSLGFLLTQLLTDKVVANDSAFEQQARAAGIAMRLMRTVANLRDDWREGRLLLPLDDLVKQKIKLSELPTFVSDGAVNSHDGNAATKRWANLMAFESQRIADLLRGAARGLESLADEGCRRFAAALLVFEIDRFTRLLQAGGDPFATRITTTTWRRITLMRRAHRLAVDPSSIESLFKSWPK